ncbi:HD domain-containing protein [Candidatus Nitrosocosmicus franklandus]|uniref:HD domain protein n=1 Tax=Candidatus Nitrosocosmicus franklandianus TaxID=1798806 RepID=A0A484I5X5_9ARCH|nr:HD domain-containing protein [Candidatus Nitrosocosmicus franklandus]VFJ12588.1 HD domain protein [Candidatus Nitrosocosmicus franklandus]
MPLRYIGEITDPIHKNIKFTLVERELIDTFIFQRLRRIRQLAGAHLVYPGALHSRFEHSIGSMFLAGLAGQTLLEKGYLDSDDMIQNLRISALLHDIGHGPFSHLFEEVLKECTTHSHEKLGERIILDTLITDILQRNGYNPITISSLSFGKHKTRFLNEIISGGLSVDLMDYLPRDSYFSGTEYGKVDYHRIINSLEVTNSKKLGISRSALYSYESMLISRYQMFKSVYFHKTVRSGEVMLLNAMKCLNSVLNLTDLSSLDSFFELHDEKVLGMLCDVRDPSLGPKEISYVNLAKDYKKRELLKCIYEYFSLSRQRQELRPDEAIKNTGEHLKSDKKKRIFDAQVSKLKSIIGKYQASGEQVFLDISSAPSIPLAPKKEEVSSIMVVDKKDEYEKSFDQIPLIYVISGYLDMIRVYTNKENRKFYETIIKDSE